MSLGLCVCVRVCAIYYSKREGEREHSCLSRRVDAHRTRLITFLTFSGSLKKYSSQSLNR